MLQLAALKESVKTRPALRSRGHVTAVRGPLIIARVPYAALGDACLVRTIGGSDLPAQIVSFENDLVSLAPFDQLSGIAPGSQVLCLGRGPAITAPRDLLGSVVDALGRPLRSPKRQVPEESAGGVEMPFDAPPPPALSRHTIHQALATGVSAIDGFCTVGMGQRLGLFAAPGAGKSTLLGTVARNAQVDVVVIGLIGERGREVQEFICNSLGSAGLEKSVLVVSTSDEAPLRRVAAAQTATAIAEYYREQGKCVLLLIDSLTRLARAVRDVTLAAGELPVRHGYTPSVYTMLPRLLERAGTSSAGSITAIYTVLTYGEEEHDPLAEEVKSILDGHIVLNTALAAQGHWPAVDIVDSLSRLLPVLHDRSDLAAIQALRSMAAKIKTEKDLVLLGGTPDPELAQALRLEGKLKELLKQEVDDRRGFEATMGKVRELAREYGG